MLLMAVVFGLEYALKQFWEAQPFKRPCLVYLFYRISHFVILLAVLASLQAHPLWIWAVLALLAVALGSIEVPLSLICLYLRHRHQIHSRWLYGLPAVLLALLSWLSPIRLPDIPKVPEFLGMGELLLFVLLSHPTNYAIRWLLDKEEDQTLPDRVGEALVNQTLVGPQRLAEVAATGGTDPVTLRAGRTIGILERWILVLFILSGHLTAIGFVVAAKSIARYSRLNEARFAEYYLLGTLYSVLITLLASAVILGGI